MIKFAVEGETFERQLVPVQENFATEIGMDSPVGRGLVMARQGNHFIAEVKGVEAVEVQVLEINDLPNVRI